MITRFKLFVARLAYRFSRKVYTRLGGSMLDLGAWAVTTVMRHGGEQAVLDLVNPTLKPLGLELVGPTQLQHEALEQMARSVDPSKTVIQ